jgi:hypothetical protein
MPNIKTAICFGYDPDETYSYSQENLDDRLPILSGDASVPVVDKVFIVCGEAGMIAAHGEGLYFLNSGNLFRFSVEFEVNVLAGDKRTIVILEEDGTECSLHLIISKDYAGELRITVQNEGDGMYAIYGYDGPLSAINRQFAGEGYDDPDVSNMIATINPIPILVSNDDETAKYKWTTGSETSFAPSLSIDLGGKDKIVVSSGASVLGEVVFPEKKLVSVAIVNGAPLVKFAGLDIVVNASLVYVNVIYINGFAYAFDKFGQARNPVVATLGREPLIIPSVISSVTFEDILTIGKNLSLPIDLCGQDSIVRDSPTFMLRLQYLSNMGFNTFGLIQECKMRVDGRIVPLGKVTPAKPVVDCGDSADLFEPIVALVTPRGGFLLNHECIIVDELPIERAPICAAVKRLEHGKFEVVDFPEKYLHEEPTSIRVRILDPLGEDDYLTSYPKINAVLQIRAGSLVGEANIHTGALSETRCVFDFMVRKELNTSTRRYSIVCESYQGVEDNNGRISTRTVLNTTTEGTDTYLFLLRTALAYIAYKTDEPVALLNMFIPENKKMNSSIATMRLNIKKRTTKFASIGEVFDSSYFFPQLTSGSHELYISLWFEDPQFITINLRRVSEIVTFNTSDLDPLVAPVPGIRIKKVITGPVLDTGVSYFATEIPVYKYANLVKTEDSDVVGFGYTQGTKAALGDLTTKAARALVGASWDENIPISGVSTFEIVFQCMARKDSVLAKLNDAAIAKSSLWTGALAAFPDGTVRISGINEFEIYLPNVETNRTNYQNILKFREVDGNIELVTFGKNISKHKTTGEIVEIGYDVVPMGYPVLNRTQRGSGMGAAGEPFAPISQLVQIRYVRMVYGVAADRTFTLGVLGKIAVDLATSSDTFTSANGTSIVARGPARFEWPVYIVLGEIRNGELVLLTNPVVADPFTETHVFPHGEIFIRQVTVCDKTQISFQLGNSGFPIDFAINHYEPSNFIHSGTEIFSKALIMSEKKYAIAGKAGLSNTVETGDVQLTFINTGSNFATGKTPDVTAYDNDGGMFTVKNGGLSSYRTINAEYELSSDSYGDSTKAKIKYKFSFGESILRVEETDDKLTGDFSITYKPSREIEILYKYKYSRKIENSVSDFSFGSMLGYGSHSIEIKTPLGSLTFGFMLKIKILKLNGNVILTPPPWIFQAGNLYYINTGNSATSVYLYFDETSFKCGKLKTEFDCYALSADIKIFDFEDEENWNSICLVSKTYLCYGSNRGFDAEIKYDTNKGNYKVKDRPLVNFDLPRNVRYSLPTLTNSPEELFSTTYSSSLMKVENWFVKAGTCYAFSSGIEKYYITSRDTSFEVKTKFLSSATSSYAALVQWFDSDGKRREDAKEEAPWVMDSTVTFGGYRVDPTLPEIDTSRFLEVSLDSPIGAALPSMSASGIEISGFGDYAKLKDIPGIKIIVDFFNGSTGKYAIEGGYCADVVGTTNKARALIRSSALASIQLDETTNSTNVLIATADAAKNGAVSFAFDQNQDADFALGLGRGTRAISDELPDPIVVTLRPNTSGTIALVANELDEGFFRTVVFDVTRGGDVTDFVGRTRAIVYGGATGGTYADGRKIGAYSYRVEIFDGSEFAEEVRPMPSDLGLLFPNIAKIPQPYFASKETIQISSDATAATFGVYGNRRAHVQWGEYELELPMPPASDRIIYVALEMTNDGPKILSKHDEFDVSDGLSEGRVKLWAQNLDFFGGGGVHTYEIRKRQFSNLDKAPKLIAVPVNATFESATYHYDPQTGFAPTAYAKLDPRSFPRVSALDERNHNALRAYEEAVALADDGVDVICCVAARPGDNENPKIKFALPTFAGVSRALNQYPDAEIHLFIDKIGEEWRNFDVLEIVAAARGSEIRALLLPTSISDHFLRGNLTQVEGSSLSRPGAWLRSIDLDDVEQKANLIPRMEYMRSGTATKDIVPAYNAYLPVNYDQYGQVLSVAASHEYMQYILSVKDSWRAPAARRLINLHFSRNVTGLRHFGPYVSEESRMIHRPYGEVKNATYRITSENEPDRKIYVSDKYFEVRDDEIIESTAQVFEITNLI